MTDKAHVEAEYDHLKDYALSFLSELTINSSAMTAMMSLFSELISGLNDLKDKSRFEFKTKLQSQFHHQIMCYTADSLSDAQNMHKRLEDSQREIKDSIDFMGKIVDYTTNVDRNISSDIGKLESELRDAKKVREGIQGSSNIFQQKPSQNQGNKKSSCGKETENSLPEGMKELIEINQSRILETISFSEDCHVDIKRKFNSLCKQLIERTKRYIDLFRIPQKQCSDRGVRFELPTSQEVNKENQNPNECSILERAKSLRSHEVEKTVLMDSEIGSEYSEENIIIENVDMMKSEFVDAGESGL